MGEDKQKKNSDTRNSSEDTGSDVKKGSTQIKGDKKDSKSGERKKPELNSDSPLEETSTSKDKGSKQIKGNSKGSDKKKNPTSLNPLKGEQKKPETGAQKVRKNIGRMQKLKNVLDGYVKLTMLTNMMKFIGTAVQAMIGWAVALVNAIVGFVATILSFGLWGVTAIVTVIVSTITVVGLIFFGGAEQKDEGIDDCSVATATVVANAQQEVAEGTDSQYEQKKFETVQKIYSILKEAGWDDIQIAGAVGNSEEESGNDPTRVEGFYGERYTIGPEKKKIMEDIRSYVDGYILPNLYSNGIQPNEDTYHAGGGSVGMGLWQITGSRQHEFFEWAKANNVSWGTVEAQTAYLLGPDGIGAWRTAYTSKSWGSPSEAALDFARGYEGNIWLGQEIRAREAERWYAKFADMKPDTAYANSALALAKTAKVDGAKKGAEGALNKCESYRERQFGKGAVPNPGGYALPLNTQDKYAVTSDYNVGRSVTLLDGTVRNDVHEGVDMVYLDGDSDILASGDGKVIRAGWGTGYGYHVVIQHSDGLYTYYGHLKEQPIVSEGEEVKQGQKIGTMGATGYATGVHLHLGFSTELYKNYVNPRDYVKIKEASE